MAEDFGDADDGEVVGVHNGVAACLAHALAADAEEFERWVVAAKGVDELRAVHFARSFSGGDQDAHRGIVAGGGAAGVPAPPDGRDARPSIVH